MNGLRKFLDQLKQLPEEIPIEPELKADRKDKDRKIREEQDLLSGAVLEVTVEPGEGGESPQEGDLVYVHYSIHSSDDDVLYSTWADEGGSGQPLAFVVGKGSWRAPRSWELAVLSMTRCQRKRLKVQPSYGYQHPDCKMSPPAAVTAHVKTVLQFDLQLTNWYPKDQVRVCGESGDMFKRVLVEIEKWEMARAPNEVSFSFETRTPAYDGTQLTGFKYHSTNPDKPLRLQLGQSQLPPALETALCHMCKGEKAVFVVPAQQMRSSSSSSADSTAGQQQSCSNGQQQEGGVSVPDPPGKAVQVELCVQLHDLVQVRDMTGDGQVLKKRIREGTGEFPVDCPLHDTRIRCHYRVRQLTHPTKPGPWVLDTTQQGDLGVCSLPDRDNSHTEPSVNSVDPSTSSSGNVTSSDDASWPNPGVEGIEGIIEVDTGCGELPEGLEMCLKLMVPNEVASVVCQPKYAYQDLSNTPSGINPAQPVEFQCILLGFEREGYWQHMSWEERWSLAENIKEKGKQLYQQKKYGYASNRYTHLLRLIESTRDFEEQEQIDKADAYKATLLSNLALVTYHQEEFARCVGWCDKALQEDPGNAKVMFRKGKALSMKGDYDEAEEALTAAADMDSSIAADVKAALAANKLLAKAATSKQKQQFSNFFGKS